MIPDAHNITTVIILLYTYRYSQDTGILSDEQRTLYEQNGYLVIKELVAASDLQVYKDCFQMICNSKVKLSGMVIMRDVAIAKSEYQDDGDRDLLLKYKTFSMMKCCYNIFTHLPLLHMLPPPLVGT